MKGKNALTFEQFLVINSKLTHVSDTWSDLWSLIFYTGLSVGRLVSLQYNDIRGNSLQIKERGRLKALCIELIPPVREMLDRRREKYPGDIFVFQSHSNRVKNGHRPVTVIAFNAALRRAAESLPDVTVSSSSARNLLS